MTSRARWVRHPLVIAAVFALSACAPASEPASLPGGRSVYERPAQAASAPPVSAPADVAGQWDVVSFDGYQPRRLSGTSRAAYADFGADGVALRMECNYTGRPGRVLHGRFVSEPAGDRIQTTIGCGPEAGPREARYFGFFERNPRVEVVTADRLRLRAGQHELILERPSLRRLSYLVSLAELQGDWEMIEVSWFPTGGGVAGIGLSDVSNRVLIKENQLRVSDCPKVDLTFRYTEDGRLLKSDGTALPSGPIACPGLSDKPDGPALPKASDAIRLLHGDPLVEKSGDGTVLVSNGDYALLMRRAPV